LDTTTRRKELKTTYKANRPEAGVYRIVNDRTGRTLIASAINLTSLRNRFDFAKATNTLSALDGRLAADFREFGKDAFSFAVLQSVTFKPEVTNADALAELRALESLWREELDATAQY
jgi:hypothetical protein